MARRKASILPINRAPDSERPFTIEDDEWLRRATAGAIKQIRKVLAMLPAGTSVSSIFEHELGWLVAAAMFGWVATRAEQAATEGLSMEEALRTTGLIPILGMLVPLRQFFPVSATLAASIGQSLFPHGHARRS